MLFLPYEMGSSSCNLPLQIPWPLNCHKAYIIYKTVGMLQTDIYRKFLSQTCKSECEWDVGYRYEVFLHSSEGNERKSNVHMSGEMCSYFTEGNI